MVLLIYRNEQHSTLRGTSRLPDYKDCFKGWRGTREHVDILHIETSHAVGNGARVGRYMVVVRPSYLLLITNCHRPAAEGLGGQKLRDSLVFMRRAIHVTMSAGSMHQKGWGTGPGGRMLISDHESTSPCESLFSNEPLRQDVSD